MVSTHLEAGLSFYGVELGGRVMRKHLGWYMDTAQTPKELRKVVLTQKDPRKVFDFLPNALAQKGVAA